MNKLITILASGLIAVLSFASAANSIELRAGIGAQSLVAYANVKESLKGNNSRTTNEEAIAAFSYTSGFIEVGVDEVYGISFGIEYSPDSIALEKETRNINPSLVGDTGAQTIDGSVEDMLMAYVAVPISDGGLYAKVGYFQAELITSESLVTGSTYSNADIEGMSVGFGYDLDITETVFVRAEGMYTEYDDLKLTGSEIDSVSSNYNVITAELGGINAKIFLGVFGFTM
jgi:opacity protein-like surface antigen